jgi:excisionase family DNA binding protein
MGDQKVSMPPAGGTVTPELLEAVARAVAAALAPPRPRFADAEPEEITDFLTARQLARRLGISHETVRRKAIAGELPSTVVSRGSRKTTRRYPRQFADEFAASGMNVADLAAFTAWWRAKFAGSGREP